MNTNSNKPSINRSQTHHMNAWFEKKGLHIAHLNVHYLYPKLDEVKLLTNYQNIDIFCLCETFLTSNFLIMSYKFQIITSFEKTGRVMAVA